MSARRITLTTDFGEYDTYVAQMKGAILSRNPSATIIDGTHKIPRHDITRGAVLLGELLAAFPGGSIHVVVVDPGVGSDRRIVIASIAGQFVVAPDNGLFTLVSDRVEQVVEFHHLDESGSVSSTFHGRDIMAPVAADLSLGREPTDFGPVTDEPLITIDLPPAKLTGDIIQGSVRAIDGFGNVTTNIAESMLHGHEPKSLVVEIAERRLEGLHSTYANIAAGELLALIGSSNFLEIAANQASAEKIIGCHVGDEVRVRCTG